MASIKTKIIGHVLIRDKQTGQILLDKNNAVHYRNMAIALARGLSNDANNCIYKLKLGNGGSSIDGTNAITYQAPNVTGSSSDLYNTTWVEIVDETQTGTPVENSVTYQASVDPQTTALVICTATISSGEPGGQALTDASADATNDSLFAFDELGLFTEDNKLLTHIVFSPIVKTANRELIITYTLTISLA